MQTTLEFAKSLALTDLDTAVAAVRHVGRDDFRLLIDTMHVVRSGSTAADLAALDASMFGYVQLSDSTLEQRNEAYRDDSSDRGVPGEGELPLVQILVALPEWLPVGVEAPDAVPRRTGHVGAGVCRAGRRGRARRARRGLGGAREAGLRPGPAPAEI